MASIMEVWCRVARMAVPHMKLKGKYELPKPPVIQRGEKITCENGHIVAEATDDIRFGDQAYDEKIGNWRIFEVPTHGDKDPRCGCGARYWKAVTLGGVLHVEGRGWIERPAIEDTP